MAGLLERDAELEHVDALARQAASGRGALVLLRAAAGIGKTALLGELTLSGRRAGLRPLSAGGGELEREFPFGVIRALLTPAVAVLGAAQRDELLGGPASFTAPLFALDGAEAQTPDAGALLHGLFWLIANLGEREPLLLVVDDGHWTDVPSLETLLYLARRIEDLPVLVVLAARPGEGGAAEPVLGRLADTPGARLLEPAPLSAAGCAAVVAQEIGGDDAFADACFAATGGNPFFLRELLLELNGAGVQPNAAGAARVRSVGPRTVARSVLVRVGALSQDAAALAQALAVLGDGAPLHRAAAVAGLDAVSASVAADALGAVQVVAAERPLAFAHPIVRTALIDSLAAGQRAMLHGRAARALDEEGAAAIDVAGHLMATDPSGELWVVERLRAAAPQALARAAPQAAASYLQRALAEPAPADQRGLIRLALGQALARIPSEAALDVLRLAAAELTDPDGRAGAVRELVVALGLAGRSDEGVEAGTSGLEQIAGADPVLIGQLQLAILDVARFDGSTRPITAQALEWVGALRGRPEFGWVLDALDAYQLGIEGRDRDRAVVLASEALAARGRSSSRFDYEAAHCQAIIALIYADELAAVREHAQQLSAEARRRGNLHGVALGDMYAALGALRAGDLSAAEADARQAQAALSGWELIFAMTAGTLAAILVERGDLPGARATIALVDLPHRPPFAARHIHVATAYGHLLAAERQWPLARDVFIAVGELRLADERPNPAVDSWRSAIAGAHLALGDAAAARPWAEQELQAARRWGSPRALGIALRTLGQIDGAKHGIGSLRESVDLLASSPARLEHARSLAALGAALRRAGKTGAARDPLREALDLATRCGAQGLAADVRAELLAAGAKPRRTALRGVEALTPSERRVAELAGQGMTNRQVAQALFVTVKTVESHLRNVYDKLGIGGKPELAGALAGPAD